MLCLQKHNDYVVITYKKRISLDVYPSKDNFYYAAVDMDNRCICTPDSGWYDYEHIVTTSRYLYDASPLGHYFLEFDTHYHKINYCAYKYGKTFMLYDITKSAYRTTRIGYGMFLHITTSETSWVILVLTPTWIYEITLPTRIMDYCKFNEITGYAVSAEHLLVAVPVKFPDSGLAVYVLDVRLNPPSVSCYQVPLQDSPIHFVPVNNKILLLADYNYFGLYDVSRSKLSACYTSIACGYGLSLLANMAYRGIFCSLYGNNDYYALGYNTGRMMVYFTLTDNAFMANAIPAKKPHAILGFTDTIEPKDIVGFTELEVCPVQASIRTL